MSNPLNSCDVDGNTINIGLMDAIEPRDAFYCPVCGEYIPEDKYNHKKNSCNDCWNDFDDKEG